MIEQVIPGNISLNMLQFSLKYLLQIFFKVSHKHVPALTGQDLPYIAATVLQMVENMRDFLFDIIIAGGKIMSIFSCQILCKHMIKYLRA